jgi:hypothetical protein
MKDVRKNWRTTCGICGKTWGPNGIACACRTETENEKKIFRWLFL